MQTCKTCSHPRRSEIERQILENRASLRAIASRFALSVASLQRHMKAHVQVSGAAGDSVAQLKNRRMTLERMEAKAEKDGDVQGVLAISREIRAIDSAIRQDEEAAKLADVQSDTMRRLGSMTLEEVNARLDELKPEVFAYFAMNPDCFSATLETMRQKNFMNVETLKAEVIAQMESNLERLRTA